MEKSIDFNVEDVYDLAADIGKEFEIIIDEYGVDLVTNLMTKVIYALEHLETSTLVKEKLENDLSDLRTTIAQLEYEKLEKAEFRHKFDQELELIEDNWRKETNQLSELVSRLQEENCRLSNSLEEKESYFPEKCHNCVTETDIKVLQTLREVINKQRKQIQSQEKELCKQTNEIDNMQQQIEKSGHLNKELRRRMKYLQSQMHTLIEEKSDLQAQVQDQQREMQMLEKRLSEAVKENIDLTTAESKLVPDLRGKIIINADDPNRPRFTLDELRHILFERNDLKAKLSDLEDELSIYKPKLSKPEKTTSSDDDLPVQGPINREPEEKLYPSRNKPAGIRKFFPSINWPRLKYQ